MQRGEGEGRDVCQGRRAGEERARQILGRGQKSGKEGGC